MAAKLQLLERGQTYVEENLGKPGAMFWIELSYNEGELRVGLGKLAAAADVPHQLDDEGARWVSWFERKGKNHDWGNVVAFRPAMIYEGRRKVVQITEETLACFLSVVVETCAGCTAAEPKITKRCMEVLREHIKTRHPQLLAANNADNDDEDEEGSEGEGDVCDSYGCSDADGGPSGSESGSGANSSTDDSEDSNAEDGDSSSEDSS